MSNKLTFEKRLSRRGIVFGFVYTLFLALFAYWAMVSWDSFTLPYQEAIFPWMAASLFINIIAMLWVGRFRYTDIALWFLVLSYLFMFGHVFTYVLQLTTTLTWDPSKYFSESDKFHASVYIVAALCFFSIGSLVVSGLKPKRSDLSQFDSEKLFYIGIICTSVGLICNAINSFTVVSATQSAGSYANYTSANTVGVFDDIGYLFVPGVIFLLFSKKLSSKCKALLFGFSIAYFLLIMTLSGSRKTAIFAIVALLLAYLSTRSTHLSLGRVLALCLFGYLFLDLIYIIRETRFDLVSVIPAYFESLRTFEFLNRLVAETLTEAGLTFYSVVGIIQTVPAVIPYELGMTFVRTILSILPIGWAADSVFNEAASTFVVNRYIGLPVGSSMFGDFYWNWGFVGGCIASFVFGLSLSFVRNKLNASFSSSPLYFAVVYIVLAGVRSGVFELFRPLLIAVLVPILIGMFFSHYRRSVKND